MEEEMAVIRDGMGIGTVLTPGTDCLNIGGKRCLQNACDWPGDPGLEF